MHNYEFFMKSVERFRERYYLYKKVYIPSDHMRRQQRRTCRLGTVFVLNHDLHRAGSHAMGTACSLKTQGAGSPSHLL